MDGASPYYKRQVNYDGEWKQGKKVDAPNTSTNWA